MTLVGRNEPPCCDFFGHKIEALAVSRWIAQHPLLGDANNDAKVTGLDLIFVQRFFGNTEMLPSTGLLLGDANDDGIVTGLDTIAVQENFGAMSGPSFVPEPATAGMLTLLGWVLSRRRR